jgi:hypothetical protein
MQSTQLPSEQNIDSTSGPWTIWLHPRAWPADNRTRKYITLAERNHSHETDLGMLRRTAETLLRQQDDRGSFYTDQEYLLGDKVDDQLGGAAVIAYFLSQTEAKKETVDALERAVRFFLDHFVFSSPTRKYRYTRSVPDREENDDWCGQLWNFWGGVQVITHGSPYLTSGTAAELRDMLGDYWGFVSTFPLQVQQPCHNQRLALCEVGVAYAKAISNDTMIPEIVAYYHEKIRPLRIHDRGHWIFSEFNQWDVHYGALSWMMLEHLAAATGDPVFAEDADEMALYLNEQISAGGFAWGGPRNNECGTDEFTHIFEARAGELGLDRLLLPEPSHLWRTLALDGHTGRGLVDRMHVSLPRRKPRVVPPTPWHFQKGNVSVCLDDDFKLHHLSSAGLEIIPAANPTGLGSGIVWLKDGVWKSDFLQRHPPKASEGLRYCDGQPIELREIGGLTVMQRGYLWETRQWWLTNGSGLLWIVHLVAHGIPKWDRLDFIIGTPVLTRVAGQAINVSTAQSAEGVEIDTQGEAATLASDKFLRFGDVNIGATLPLEFNRPSREAFHTFPSLGRNWRDFTSSNELRLKIDKEPGQIDSRESIFFAIEINTEPPAPELGFARTDATVRSKSGTFRAHQSEAVWAYTFEGAEGTETLPFCGFGSRV